MFLSRVSLVTLALLSAGATQAQAFGRPATPAEVKLWNIDILPDGTGLPEGKGSVAQGAKLYNRSDCRQPGIGAQQFPLSRRPQLCGTNTLAAINASVIDAPGVTVTLSREYATTAAAGASGRAGSALPFA